MKMEKLRSMSKKAEDGELAILSTSSLNILNN
jgi:hypothetical protein